MSNASRDRLPSPTELRLNQYAQLVAVMIVVVGCYLVLHPFIPAVLFAAVVCSATWPLYVRLRKVLWGRPALAALAMTLLLIVLVVGPTVLLAVTLADNATAMVETGKAMLNGGPLKPPAWVREIPVVGEMLTDYWRRLASSGDSLSTQWKGLIDPARNFLIGAGKAAGEGLLQLTLASFIGFFFYRDGEALMLAIRNALDKIAGVPAAFLLAALIFVLSIVPIGPPMLAIGLTLAQLWITRRPGEKSPLEPGVAATPQAPNIHNDINPRSW